MPYDPPTRCPRCGKQYKAVRGRGRSSRRGCPFCTGWGGRRQDEANRVGWGRIYSTPALKRAWKYLRLHILASQPICVMCQKAAATHVDHKDGTNYRDDSGQGYSWLNPQMCRSLCASCHRSRTSQQGGRTRQ